MKTMISITLDAELVEALRKGHEGISQTINTLLQGHVFGSSTKEGMVKAIEEKTAIIEKANEDIKVLKDKLDTMPKYIVRHT